jgi:hypothetical protein
MSSITGWNRGTWNQGTWGYPLPVEVTGVSSTASVGSVTIAFVTNATGVSSATAVGSPTLVTNSLLTPAGVSAASQIGTSEVDFVFRVDGVSATASVGNPVIWMTINTSQEPHFGADDWSSISTTQTPTWTEIAA